MSLDPDAEIFVTVEPVTTVAVVASQVSPAGPQWMGAWSPLVTYQPTQLVTRNGSVWIATEENIGIDPAIDASHNAVASLTSPGLIALGSPQTIATTFTVDRVTNVVALSIAQAYLGSPGGQAGIASAINVPGIGVQWLSKGVPDAGKYVTLDTLASLSPGIEYWLVLLAMPGANIQIDQGPDLVGSHMAWADDFWYGTTEPSNNFNGVYGVPVILFGTTGDDAWQLYLQGTP